MPKNLPTKFFLVVPLCFMSINASSLYAQENKNSADLQKGKKYAESELDRMVRQGVTHALAPGGLYKNQKMGFSAKFPEGWKLSEFGDHAMRISESNSGSGLIFSASCKPTTIPVTVDQYYDECVAHLPAGCSLRKQERTSLDGASAIAAEFHQSLNDMEMYKQRIFLIRDKKFFLFEFACPLKEQLAKTELIKGIWSSLHLL